ncbi:hypothetical protein SLS59_004145 [Nothophoma quercina]|uniref:RING-type domain-containing protein n=1 Tax=Nothophoma quercina TaxID=749835 RepID=A0ABR3RKE7_9PLEO
MTLFANRAVFMQLGLEAVAPSAAHMYQDCYICKDPLDVNIHTTASITHHAAVRIHACGHMHGQECLAAWLDAGNSYPTCKRMLFETSTRSVSQADINHVVHFLRRMVGEKRIMASVARLVGKQELERAQLRRTQEVDMQKMKAKEAQARQDDLEDDDDWMAESDDAGDFDMDVDEDFEVDEEDEEGGVPWDEEDLQ